MGERTLDKIRVLAAYMENTHGITLARAVSVNPSRMEKILSGEEELTKKMIARIAAYFFIPVDILTDDSKDLPDPETLQLDEDLLSIQRNDIANDIEREKQKHFISRNWVVLGYRKRVKLVLSILLITVPLIAYILFCGSEVAYERIDDARKYEIGSDGLDYDIHDPIQKKYHDDLEGTSRKNNPDAYYVEVTVGTVLERIKNIHSETSSYETRMQLYFKFDKDEFRNMFRHYARNVLADQIIDDYYISSEEDRPASIDFNMWIDDHASFFEEWVETHDHLYYPGETPSNVLTDKETMFVLGNGEFVPDSLGMLKDLEEVQYYDENGNLRTMCYQKIRFNGSFEKGFDSVRYPLDSVQFKMYILPTMDADYIRYVPDRSTDSDGVLVSGFAPYFAITSGYRPIHETDKVDNFTLRLNYYYDTNNDPAVHFDDSVRTQLEIIVRANRVGISLFLQAFINLFSVVIWIIIAFYSQSYTGEDSVGMLGTGLFGVISSMIVGLSMVSDAGIFSLITMINIFTLAVIMIMTYQAIAAKRAQVRKDKVLIAYNGIKLRVLFVLLTVCTVAMFVVIPAIAYMWGV